MDRSPSDEITYPLRTVSRLTGLSPDLLRAWEKRHGIVVPQRTPGGTRRYTARDVDRLRLVKSVVDAGHRVGQVARLDPSELQRLSRETRATPDPQHDEVFTALERFDASELQRLLSIRLSTLGASRFAREVAAPILVEIGERWARGVMSVPQEHLASAVVRTLVGSALQPTTVSASGPRILFATPASERHELGLLMAAVTSLGAGANAIYLGADLPMDAIAGSARMTGAGVVALSIVSLRRRDAQRLVDDLRSKLEAEVHLWIGGSAAGALTPCAGVEYIDSLEGLEQRVSSLRLALKGEP